MSLCWVHPWCLFCLVQSRYPLLGPPLVFMLSVQSRYPHRVQCAVSFVRVRWIFSSSDTAEISLNMGRKTLKPLKQGQSHNIATRTKRVIWYHSFYNLQLQGHDHWRNWRIVLVVSVKVWFWMKLLFLYFLLQLIVWYFDVYNAMFWLLLLFDVLSQQLDPIYILKHQTSPLLPLLLQSSILIILLDMLGH